MCLTFRNFRFITNRSGTLYGLTSAVQGPIYRLTFLINLTIYFYCSGEVPETRSSTSSPLRTLRTNTFCTHDTILDRLNTMLRFQGGTHFRNKLSNTTKIFNRGIEPRAAY